MKKSAKYGDPRAQFNLGRMYLNGEVVKRNIKNAERWLSKAAEQGHAKAKRLVEEVTVLVEFLSKSPSIS